MLRTNLGRALTCSENCNGSGSLAALKPKAKVENHEKIVENKFLFVET